MRKMSVILSSVAIVMSLFAMLISMADEPLWSWRQRLAGWECQPMRSEDRQIFFSRGWFPYLNYWPPHRLPSVITTATYRDDADHICAQFDSRDRVYE